jgi:RNA polymerase sigma-70 factor (ECF subfamily)
MDVVLFEPLAMPLFNSLYSFAHWLTGNRAEAEDLVQETYVKALKGFGSFQEGTDFRAWIYRILRNTFLTSRTGLAARKTTYLEEEEAEHEYVPVQSVTPETVLLQKENAQMLMDVLGSLPMPHREILLLCDVEELSYRDAAEVLSIPVGTVMSRLSRARGKCRQMLQERSSVGYHHAV